MDGQVTHGNLYPFFLHLLFHLCLFILLCWYEVRYHILHDSQLLRIACMMCPCFCSFCFLFLAWWMSLISWTGDIADTPISSLSRASITGSELKCRYAADITTTSPQASLDANTASYSTTGFFFPDHSTSFCICSHSPCFSGFIGV
ncbi:hypothetical protein BJX76DRAFT_130105 [Aspergillus varians]